MITTLPSKELTTLKNTSSPHNYTMYGYCPPNNISPLLKYAGEAWHPSLQCYLLGNGYRAYSPTLMRFLSPDRLSPFGKGGINSYCYCSGDPINYIDPTGRARKMRLYLTRKQQQRERARALQEQERFAAARDKVFRQPSNIDAIVSHLPGADGANFIGALPRELNRDISLPLLHRDINTIKTRQQDVDKLSPLGFELDFQVATRNLRVPEALHILYDACDEIRKGAIYNKDFITKWYHEMRNRYDPKKRSIIPRRHSL
ncbi:RHS repeat-associated core domain-containing protein [Pseudomonas kurunegalensis]|uniref:RHS repeat-associated core domain-containing protein n=1 Tax=Pseudomonas kurunegalensis TaxID=485880 RepID=UPI003D9A45B4